MLSCNEMFNKLEDYQTMTFEEEKYSYLIVKPNGVRHFRTYLEELKKENYTVLGFYAIQDYEEVSLALHPSKKKRRHIVPINKMFKTLFSNYAVAILVTKSHITYEDFVEQLYKFKKRVRSLFDTPNLAYVFEVSKLLNEQPNQLLKVVDLNGRELPKKEMNQEGVFQVYSVNSLHSPDPDVNETISEMLLLRKMGIFSDENKIPDMLVENILRYETFSFIKDM